MFSFKLIVLCQKCCHGYSDFVILSLNVPFWLFRCIDLTPSNIINNRKKLPVARTKDRAIVVNEDHRIIYSVGILYFMHHNTLLQRASVVCIQLAYVCIRVHLCGRITIPTRAIHSVLYVVLAIISQISIGPERQFTIIATIRAPLIVSVLYKSLVNQ